MSIFGRKEKATATVIYVSPAGDAREIAVPVGDSVMEGAIKHGVNGIVAECGGACMCATCHVYVDEAWLGRLPPMSDEEDALLDGAAAERRANSRLSCQIKLAAELDGLVMRLPERQI